MPFEIIHSEKIYQGRVFGVRCDRVSLPNGRSVELDIVEHPGAVTLVPVDDQGNLWFVRQYRHGGRVNLLELPAGSLEPGEPPEACALREVREEIEENVRPEHRPNRPVDLLQRRHIGVGVDPPRSP